MLTNDEIKKLSQTSIVKTFCWILADWLLIVAAFWLPINFDSWWAFAVSVILIARTQLALAILMHDGAHRRLFQNAYLNDYLGQFLAAAPILFSLGSYKQNH